MALAVVEITSVVAADVPHKPAAIVVTAISVGVLAGRRWWPLAATVAAFGALTVSVAVVPRSTAGQFFGVLATFAIAGAVNAEREAVVALVAGVAMLGYAAWVDPLGGGTSDFLLSLAFGTTMWGAGLLVARRGRHLASVVDQAAQAEQSRQAETRKALAEERATIARELHDIVSHGLSVVVVQTLAARSLLSDMHDAATGEVDRHLDAVESTARDSLAEMRRMLGLLQNTSDAGNGTDLPSPAPGLRHLDELVERVTAGGARASLHVDAGIALLPGLDLAVYRITQEALTNVVKHAPGAPVDVDIRRLGGRLVLTVRNGPSHSLSKDPPLGAGRGLLFVRERAALYGGTVTAGPLPEGGFLLSVVFPEEMSCGAAATTEAAPA